MSDFTGEGGGYGASQAQISSKKTSPFGSSLQQAMGQGAPGGSLGSGHGSPSPAHGNVGGHPTSPAQPREVASIPEELIARPVQDIAAEFKTFFSLKQLFQIDPQTDSPEDQARKQQIHSKWQSLTQSEQQVAQAQYQHDMQVKQQRQQQEEQSRQQKAANQQPVEMPSGPNKGTNATPGNRKKTMTQQVNSNRQSFNKIQSSG